MSVLWPKSPPLPPGRNGQPVMPEVPGDSVEDRIRKMIPLPVLPLPLDPAVLARAIQSSAQMGQFDAPIYRFAGVIPSGTTVILPLYARQGFVGVMLSPVKLYCSAHHPAIVVNLYVDDVIRATPDGIPMTADGEVSLQQFWLVHYGVRLEVVNGAPFDVVMTLDSQAGVVEKTLFDSKYMPLLAYSWASIMAFASLVKGNTGG